jgi:potassium channel subfamily K, other eukaryote
MKHHVPAMATMSDNSTDPIPSATSDSSDGQSTRKDVRDPEKFDDSQDFQKIIDKNETPPVSGLQRTRTRTLGKLRFRGTEDDLPTDWWFASTAIPLVAATFAPMANLLSIAALVVSWRNHTITNDPLTRQSTSEGYPDPPWCYNLNVASLVCGFLGNIFLLFNFTRRIRYIVALPATIILFYIASGILIAITASMNIYVPPEDGDIYSQGFWHAIIAACLYVFNSMILMVNMVGYFLGHYPQHFNLTDEQRNLILQTMLFFLWLGGGAGIFTVVCDWTFPDALYFCDVTILTIGFGDFVAQTDTGRGLVFPYSVGGIIMLGLMVSSIAKFAGELTKDNVVRKHVENRRVSTLSRAVTLDEHAANLLAQTHRERVVRDRDLEAVEEQRPSFLQPPRADNDLSLSLAPTESRRVEFRTEFRTDMQDEATQTDDEPRPSQFLKSTFRAARKTTWQIAASALKPMIPKKPKAIIMKEEKDRFDAMRHLQKEARQFKKWSALIISLIAFGILWCVGAVVFWIVESRTQGLTYFQALYFCYVSLLTVGYGDFSPRSNAGKPFFIVWSLIAIPTMTILISGMGDTVIVAFKRATIKLGDFTLLPKAGTWHDVLESQPWLLDWLQRLALRRKIKKGLPVGPRPEDDRNLDHHPTIEQLADEDLSDAQMAKRLAFAIRRTADDLVHHPGKHYEYEDWCQFTRLIRFTKMKGGARALEADEDQEGVVEWDWLDENSPMLSEQSEAEWVLDRLCESLLRWLRRNCVGEEDDKELFGRESRTESGLALVRTRTEMVPPDEAAVASRTRSGSGSVAGGGVAATATGARAMLDFFTGERGDGENAYANREAEWSSKARLRRTQQMAAGSGGRRRSSTGERKGPFARLHLRSGAGSGAKSGSGSGKAGGGNFTLKARAFGLSRT